MNYISPDGKLVRNIETGKVSKIEDVGYWVRDEFVTVEKMAQMLDDARGFKVGSLPAPYTRDINKPKLPPKIREQRAKIILLINIAKHRLGL